MVNINDFNSKNLKLDKKSYEDILIQYFGYKALDGQIVIFQKMVKQNQKNITK